MPMSDNDKDPQRRRMVNEIRRHVREVRFRFIDEYRDCRLTTQTKRDLASAAMKYWDVLHEHRNEQILDDDDFPDIGPIRNRLGRRVQITTKSKRLGKSRTTKQVPAIDELNPEYIIQVTRELDDCSKKLGFAAATADSIPNDKASEDDLRALLEARGQTEAVEKLPSEQGGDD